MTDANEDRGAGPRPRRSLVFVSRQRLLAGTLARLFVAADEGWAIQVLDTADPHLLERCSALEPTVLVADVDWEVIADISLVANLVKRLPGTTVLVLGEMDAAATAEAFRLGARGVMTYSASPQQVHDAVQAAAEDRSVVAPAMMSALLEQRHLSGTAPRNDDRVLSPRELEILRLLVRGRPTREIAADLGISVQTVRKHTQNVLAKLQVHSKLAAAAVAVRDGLV